MAKLKVQEFAELYNIKRTNVYTYQKRNKLIIIDGELDLNDPINNIWIQKRELKNALKENKKEESKDITNKKEDKNIKSENKNIKTINETSFLLKTERLKQEQLEENIRSLKLKNDRESNKLISKEDVGLMVNSYLNRFIMNLQQQINVLIRDHLNQLQADNSTIKEACSKSIEIINTCQDLALKEIEIGFKNVTNAKK